MRGRLLLLLLAVVGLALAPRSASADTPARRIEGEVAALASAVDACQGAEVAYVSTASSLNFVRGHAWILTLWVEDAPAYEASYFVLSEIDGRLVGEVMHSAGPDGTYALTGEALARYLERVGLDFTPIRAVFERHDRLRR